MLIAKAYTKYIRISPRKLRLAIDLIRGERANQALVILANLNKKARICVEKTLKSALSNAGQSPAIKTDDLFISKITADRSEEHTSELQSHSFISYAVFCLKKKT